jgi:hypothetical protein
MMSPSSRPIYALTLGGQFSVKLLGREDTIVRVIMFNFDATATGLLFEDMFGLNGISS